MLRAADDRPFIVLTETKLISLSQTASEAVSCSCRDGKEESHTVRGVSSEPHGASVFLRRFLCSSDVFAPDRIRVKDTSGHLGTRSALEGVAHSVANDAGCVNLGLLASIDAQTTISGSNTLLAVHDLLVAVGI